jgi:hypothetical protein
MTFKRQCHSCTGFIDWHEMARSMAGETIMIASIATPRARLPVFTLLFFFLFRFASFDGQNTLV